MMLVCNCVSVSNDAPFFTWPLLLLFSFLEIESRTHVTPYIHVFSRIVLVPHRVQLYSFLRFQNTWGDRLYIRSTWSGSCDQTMRRSPWAGSIGCILSMRLVPITVIDANMHFEERKAYHLGHLDSLSILLIEDGPILQDGSVIRHPPSIIHHLSSVTYHDGQSRGSLLCKQNR